MITHQQLRDKFEVRLHQMAHYGEAPGHVADQLIKMVEQVPVAPRTLDSLTEAEALECFRIAFAYEPTSPVFHVDKGAHIHDHERQLCIRQNGAMEAHSVVTGESEEFFAVALIDYLRSIGVGIVT